MTFKAIPLLLLPTAFVLALMACQGASPIATETSPLAPTATATPTPSPTPTPTPINPEALLALSGERMAALKTFAFLLSHEGGGTDLGGNLSLVIEEAEGAVTWPKDLKLDVVGQAGSVVIKLSLISTGDATYMTNPFTGQWQEMEADANPLGFFDPWSGIAAIMASVEQPAYRGVAAMQKGAQAHLLHGRLPAPALASLLGAAASEAVLDVELWLEVETLYLLRVVVQGRLTTAEDAGIVRTIILSDFDKPVEIEPPFLGG